ncbi:MAG: hypothetical protein ACOC0P_06535 [Planctomycetota bacterium]
MFQRPLRANRTAVSVAAAAAAAITAPTVLLMASGTAEAQSTQLILNEFNAVGSQKWLDNPNDPACEGPQGFDCSDGADSFFGRVLGNGGDWIELVVVDDNTDLRGWEIYWAQTGNSNTNGQDIWFGSGNVEQGIITFSDDPLWASLPAGTIITITEKLTVEGGLDTDTSLDPCNGDWWINVNSFDLRYISTVTNVLDDFGQLDPPGSFDVGNDDWQGTVVDNLGNDHFGPVGEDFAGSPGWGGSGVNSREVGRLEIDPDSSVLDGRNFDDADNSTFGMANRWNKPIMGGGECPVSQDLRPIRSSENCTDCIPVILNEYNAVDNDEWLNGGDADGDINGDFTTDGFFGRSIGNGGNWFELLVLADDTDLRGYRIDWTEVSDGISGTINFSNDAFWSNLSAGTIITITEWTTIEGGLDTDTSLGGSDNWANINSFDTQYIISTTSNEPGHISGQFNVSNDDWNMTILDDGGNLVFGPVGEGAYQSYNGRGISSTEVCSLIEDPVGSVTPAYRYTENIESTFGAANETIDCESGQPFTQDLSVLPDPVCSSGGSDLTLTKNSCPAPLNLSISNATPNGTVAVLYSVNQGSFTIPGSFVCAGTQLGLGGVPTVGAQVRADANGEAVVNFNRVPAAACNFFLQALDVATCNTSNVVQ